MDKYELTDLLSKYQQGSAAPREKSMIDAYMMLMEKEPATLSAYEKEAIHDRIWSALTEAQTEGSQISRRGLHSMPVLRKIKIAAVWIALLGLAVSGYIFRYDFLDMVNPIALKTIETSPYEVKQVMLPDSSIVTLSQNSRISFPVRYRRPARQVSLSGTAFFDISHNASAPFTVHSGELVVKVLGTSFEVNDSKGGYEASVTVVNGRVEVSRDNHPLAVLGRGQQIKYDKFSHQFNVLQHINAIAATNWRSKQLVFNETQLAVVFKTLQVYYGMKIEVPENVLKAEDTFSGSFDRNETRKAVLDVICLSSGMSYTVSKDSTIVIKK